MRNLYASALFVMLVPVALAGGACTLIELPEATDGIVGAGGGQEGADECTTADDCLPTGTDCIVRDCVDGQCEYGPADDFVPIGGQAVGDCVQVVCNGEGGEKQVSVDDPFDDGNECTSNTCMDGEPQKENLLGEPCTAGVCDEVGNCVQCLNANDCAPQTNNDPSDCQAGICVPASCTDGVFNGDETALDCGGPCAPCADGLDCLVGADCQSKVCDEADMTCSAPTCDDGATNGDESDEDCGGPDCPRCAPGSDCTEPTDCASFVCIVGICEAPTCIDGVGNGGETDVDCGGSDCGPCAAGEKCGEARDCASKVCEGNLCQAPSCSDGIQNGSEKGVDCGGGCPSCKDVNPIPIEQPVQQ